MQTYTVEDWIETEAPKPFGEPINGKQATMSSGYFVKKKAVKVEDVIAFIKQMEKDAKERFATGTAYDYKEVRLALLASLNRHTTEKST
jgi:hypothetical protein